MEILGKDGKAVWSADLVEEGDPLDEEAHKYKNTVPTWHGLSKHGTAEGQLVYANYGSKEVSLESLPHKGVPNCQDSGL